MTRKELGRFVFLQQDSPLATWAEAGTIKGYEALSCSTRCRRARFCSFIFSTETILRPNHRLGQVHAELLAAVPVSRRERLEPLFRPILEGDS
jgi:hypothetical protein